MQLRLMMRWATTEGLGVEDKHAALDQQAAWAGAGHGRARETMRESSRRGQVAEMRGKGMQH